MAICVRQRAIYCNIWWRNCIILRHQLRANITLVYMWSDKILLSRLQGLIFGQTRDFVLDFHLLCTLRNWYVLEKSGQGKSTTTMNSCRIASFKTIILRYFNWGVLEFIVADIRGQDIFVCQMIVGAESSCASHFRSRFCGGPWKTSTASYIEISIFLSRNRRS